jgi:chromosome segregation ATPase
MPQTTGTNDFNEGSEKASAKSHQPALIALAVGLAAALAGDAYLISRSNHLSEDIARTQSSSQIQLSKLNEATATLLDQEKQHLDQVAQQMKQEMKQEVRGVSASATGAIKQARLDAQKSDEELAAKLAEQRQQAATEMSRLQETANSRFTEVATNVDGVKANVEVVKADLTSARNDIARTGADLKRAMGDMGVMSGLIATNSKDLDALRALGERNYFEFDITKQQAAKRVGDIALTLKKADPKHNRFTMDVLADDRHLEKKDKTINEPVQLYVSGNMQPYEIVVNQVTKDHVTGYLSTPKVKLARR